MESIAIAAVIISLITAIVFIWFVRYTNPKPDHKFTDQVNALGDQQSDISEHLQKQIDEIKTQIGKQELSAITPRRGVSLT